jgi:hypothetical protein
MGLMDPENDHASDGFEVSIAAETYLTPIDR